MPATRARTRKPATKARRGQKKAAKGRRKDPRPRHTDGAAPWAKLNNRDPHKHYVYVFEGDQEHGIAYYRSIGYQVEEHTKDGVAPMAGVTGKPGEPISMRGHTLMSCPMERRMEIEEYGPDGVTGQALADEIDGVILDKRGGIDHLRGLHGPRGLDVEVGTRAPEVEI